MSLYTDLFSQAQTLIADLVTKRDAWLEPGPGACDTGLIIAKKADLMARQAAAEFFRITEDPAFVEATAVSAMTLSVDQAARIDALAARWRGLEDTWSGLARRLEAAK